VDQAYGPGSAGFGILSAIVLALLVVWAGLAVWVATHRSTLASALNRVGATAVVGRVRAWAADHLSGSLRVVARWLSVDAAAALALLSGAALVALLAAGFAELLDNVIEGEVIDYVDAPVSQWVAGQRDLWVTETMKVLTHLGDVGSLAVAVVLLSAWVGWRARSWLPAVLAVSGLLGVAVVMVAAKVAVGRSRPPSLIAVIVEDGFSFPSGHSTGSFALAVLGAWMIGRWVLHGWAARVALWASALALAALVGLSRIYLGVHYLSDVLAGAFLGASWAGAVMLVGAWWEASRRSPQPAPSPR
jgi:undecaprenyl-diphosphatase